VHAAPSRAAPTCRTQTSKPTVVRSSGRRPAASVVHAHSICRIMPGVDRTLAGRLPRTSVSRSPSAMNCSSWVATGADHILRPRLTEPVAIIGATGALGFGLAVRWARAGVPVTIGSRSQERATEAVARARGTVPEGEFDGFENARAAGAAEVVVLSVPFRSQSETLTNLKGALRPGQLVVDTTVPLAAAVSGRATRTLGVWQGSAAQQAQEMVPEGVRVVSALHTVSARTLSDLGHDLDEDVLVCGDDRDDKRRVVGLIDLIDGLRGVDCGRLEMSRLAEGLTPLLISINVRHKTQAGIKITGLP
jgi:NADPH-dependent F420 reductase